MTLRSALTLYSIETRFYVCCSKRHLKTLWQRKKFLFQLKKMFISFSRVNIQDFSKCRLLQECCKRERVKYIFIDSFSISMLYLMETRGVVGTKVNIRTRSRGSGTCVVLDTRLDGTCRILHCLSFICFVINHSGLSVW